MSETDFNYWLSWMLAFSALPSFCAAIVCVLFFNLVERKISKFFFAFGFLLTISMTLIRLLTSFDFSNFNMRITNASMVVFGQTVVAMLFYLSYSVQKRERLKRSQAEQKLIESSFPGFVSQSIHDSINSETVSELIKQLHPRDAKKLARKFNKFRTH